MSKRAQATKLRQQGKSYGEIMKILNISSKGTLSSWFHNLELSPTAKRRLQHNIALAYQRGLFAFNAKRTKNIRVENKKILQQSTKEIAQLSKKELLLIGTALYWAEGANRELAQSYQIVSFTNSDPKMVKIFMRYLREVLLVSDSKIKPGVIIYPNLDPESVRRFWARITNLPKQKFWITVSISKASKLKRSAHFLPYGTAHIRVHSRQLFYKIQGHIAGIARQIK